MIKLKIPFPPWDNRPRLGERLRWVWEAFNELQTCRPVGQALGAIPWTAIHEYAAAKEVRDSGRFEHLIRTLDTAFLEAHHREVSRRRGTDTTPRD